MTETRLFATSSAQRIRDIYYARIRAGTIWMLTLYAKNETENIAPHILRRVKGEIDG